MKNNEADDARKNEIYKNKILTVPNVLSAFRLLLVPALAWLYLVQRHGCCCFRAQRILRTALLRGDSEWGVTSARHSIRLRIS